MLKYTEEKIFTQEQVQQLFLSINWERKLQVK